MTEEIPPIERWEKMPIYQVTVMHDCGFTNTRLVPQPTKEAAESAAFFSAQMHKCSTGTQGDFATYTFTVQLKDLGKPAK